MTEIIPTDVLPTFIHARDSLTALVFRYLSQESNFGERGMPRMIVLEVFQGFERTLPREGQKLVVSCTDFPQAQRVQRRLSGFGRDLYEVVVAHPHALPVKHEGVHAVVDAHEATNVGHDAASQQLGSIAKGLRLSERGEPGAPPTTGRLDFRRSIRQRLVDLGREVAVLFNVPTITRPIYFTEDQHETMKTTFSQVFAERAALIKPGGLIIMSIPVARSDRSEHTEYDAFLEIQGQVLMRQSEFEELAGNLGLAVVDRGVGMAPKTQAVAVNAAGKALLMSIVGSEKRNVFLWERIIPKIHEMLESPQLHRALGMTESLRAKSALSREGLRASSPGGIVSDALPHRLVYVLRKT